MKKSLILAAVLSAICIPASALTTWTDWTSATIGSAGPAIGTLGGRTVTYVGPILGPIAGSQTYTDGSFATDYAGWAPDSSFVGGTSTTSPATVGDIITLQSSPNTSTLTFSAPITDPVFAIYSLGRPGSATSFTFDATPSLQVGGPNGDYGGSAITVAGNTVSGQEGNGVVQFTGTFNSLSFTSTPEASGGYGFSVGANGFPDTVGPVPEPATWALMSLGLAVVGGGVRRRRGASGAG